MRTSIEIDDKLMKQAMKAPGSRTKRETVAKALELLIRIDGQKAIRRLRGKLHWEGDIDAWRRGECSSWIAIWKAWRNGWGSSDGWGRRIHIRNIRT